jgi:hypothetical protein
MWLVPVICEITPLWEEIQSSKVFVIQRSHTSNNSMWKSVVGTLHTVFESKQQAPYRILLKKSFDPIQPGDEAYVISQAETEKEIDVDWKWLEDTIMEDAESLEDQKDIEHFVLTKIESLVTQTGTHE